MLGLPAGVTVCLFDLDGVLTQTAKVHAAAWKEMFDAFLRRRAAERGEDFVPFDAVRDYDEYVDGRPRADGVRAFLASRGIELPEGSPDDPPDAETISGLGDRKNEIVLRLIREHGVEPYDGSVRYVKAARDGGLRCCVVSSSTNCRDVLAAAGIADLFEEIIDGHVAEAEQLRGKPAPDTYLAGARAVGETPAHGGGVRGRAGRRRGRASREVRDRGRRRSGRAGGRAAGARRRRRRRRSQRTARGAVIRHRAFPVEPWASARRSSNSTASHQTESVFALSNGHIGLRGNLDEGEPFGLPGTYLAGFYELRPLPYAEAAYG